mmetsp:Transcript_37496/g.108035  ORF Transcript_37496/g.108035 Transcript_37496/m.108035 type:complete len:257 (-) Transcript_37496:338-1108(-)
MAEGILRIVPNEALENGLAVAPLVLPALRHLAPAQLQDPKLVAELAVLHAVGEADAPHLQRGHDAAADQLLQDQRPLHPPRHGWGARVGLDAPHKQAGPIVKLAGEHLQLLDKLLADSGLAGLCVLAEESRHALLGGVAEEVHQMLGQRVNRLRDKVLGGVGDLSSVVAHLKAVLVTNVLGRLLTPLLPLGSEDPHHHGRVHARKVAVLPELPVQARDEGPLPLLLRAHGPALVRQQLHDARRARLGDEEVYARQV